MVSHHSFGGDWTNDKLLRLKKYLVAYATIMNKQPFRFAFIDAFAGTGYRTISPEENELQLAIPELLEPETRTFVDGSARIALEVKPRFSKYIFIERNANKIVELEALRNSYPELSKDVSIVNEDANEWLQDRCRNYDWKKNRAVLFLDPYGMQVAWNTIEAIAETKAIDLWILFPLGVAVNRLLRRDAQINPAVRKRLNVVFGSSGWYRAFYKKTREENLFGEENLTIKNCNFDSIAEYFVNRLSSIFPGVASNPLLLLNRKNIPLYLLCFAAANVKGAKTAIKIAQEILE
ncbi:MAG: three-Cys-motif partner protein TcmP [bacterium]